METINWSMCEIFETYMTKIRPPCFTKISLSSSLNTYEALQKRKKYGSHQEDVHILFEIKNEAHGKI